MLSLTSKYKFIHDILLEIRRKDYNILDSPLTSFFFSKQFKYVKMFVSYGTIHLC